MAATVTESIVLGLEQGTKKGSGIYVARLQIDDGETLTPGFKKIRAVMTQAYGNVAAAWHYCCASAHPSNAEAGAQITFSVGAVADYADDSGQNFYAIIIGDNTSGTT